MVPPAMLVVGLIVLGSAAVLAVYYFGRGGRSLRAHIQQVCTSGYLPPPPTAKQDRRMRKVSRIAVWLQVGRVRWSGLEHLDGSAPKLIVPTHGHYLDPFVLAAQMRHGSRVMAARGLFRAGGGLGGLLFSQWGAFCTDLDPGKGLAALRTAVRLLVDGATLVVFPEGWAHMDGEVGEFNPGTASIALLAAAKLQQPIPIIPVYMAYGKYPGRWIRSLPTGLQCLLLVLGWWRYRRGVQVIFGPPLLTSDLPTNPRMATERIRAAVLALNPRIQIQA